MKFNFRCFKEQMEKIDLDAKMALNVDFENEDVIAIILLPNNLLIHESDFDVHMSIEKSGGTVRIVSNIDIDFMSSIGRLTALCITSREDISCDTLSDVLVVLDPGCLEDDEKTGLLTKITNAYMLANVAEPEQGEKRVSFSMSELEPVTTKSNAKQIDKVSGEKKLFYF